MTLIEEFERECGGPLPGREDYIAWLEEAVTRARAVWLEESVKRAHDPDGCACIKDMPGDNYTCTAHRTLIEYAQQHREIGGEVKKWDDLAELTAALRRVCALLSGVEPDPYDLVTPSMAVALAESAARQLAEARRQAERECEEARQQAARECAEIVAVAHGCGVAYRRILHRFGLEDHA